MRAPIFTSRLVLRPFEERDLNDFYEYAKDPLTGPMAGWKPHESLEESRGILESFRRDETVWAIEHLEEKKLIGSAGLHRDGKRTVENVRMLGYALSRDYWGRGLMPEAAGALMAYGFEKLGLRLISVYHYPFNGQSRRVIEKLGFRYEGTMRLASLLPDGTVTDDVCYSITKEEFMRP